MFANPTIYPLPRKMYMAADKILYLILGPPLLGLLHVNQAQLTNFFTSSIFLDFSGLSFIQRISTNARFI